MSARVMRMRVVPTLPITIAGETLEVTVARTSDAPNAALYVGGIKVAEGTARTDRRFRRVCSACWRESCSRDTDRKAENHARNADGWERDGATDSWRCSVCSGTQGRVRCAEERAGR